MSDIAATIRSKLSGAQRVLLMGHRDPDGDSAGSILALAATLGDRQIYCYSHGALPYRYQFLDPDGRLTDRIDTTFEPDVAVAIESPGRDRLGDGLRMLIPATTLINIDHHHDNEAYGDINWLDPDAAACGEMIFELLQGAGGSVDTYSATCLYTAILTDTGRFQYRGTTARTLSICSELVRRGANPADITRQVYFGMPMSYLRLMRAALDGMESVADDRVLALTLLPEDFERAGASPQDAEGIIDLTLLSDHVQIGLLFRQSEIGRIKVSFRSQDSIDVARLAAHWGGGGHRNASGCLIDGDFAQVKTSVLSKAAALLENGS